MSHKVRMVLMSVGLVAFAAVVWFFVLSPIRADIADTQTAIDDVRSKLSVAEGTLSQAETTRAEGKRNQARLLELAKMVPSSEELPSLLLQIQDLADQSGIEFISITPGEVSVIEGVEFELLPLDLTFTGTFFDVSDFVYRAEQMVAGAGRLLAVKSIGLALSTDSETPSASASVSPDLDVNLSLYAFVMPPGGTGGSIPAAEPSATGDTSSTTNATAAQ